MAVVTLPPVLIDPGTFSRQSRVEENPFLFQHAGLQYMVGVPGLTGSNGLAVFVTLDNGATWSAALDVANTPADTPRAPAVFYNAPDGTLEIFYRNASGHKIVTFTLAGLSSTWGTPGTLLADNIIDTCFFCLLSDGVTYELFCPNGAGNHIVYYTYSAGVWSAATNLITGTFTNSGTGVKGGALSSADVAFFTTIDNVNSVKAHRVTAAFAITTHTLGGGVSNRTSVLLDEANDTVAINWNGNQEIYADLGTPLSAPTYTHYVLFSLGGSSTVSYPFLAVDTDGKINSFFVQVDYSTLPITDVLWQTIFDGVSTWSTPIVYYDEVDNPPSDSVPDQNDQFIHTGDAVLLASGDFLILTAMETEDGSPPVDHCTGFALLASAPPPTSQTLELTKIISGGPASPSDFTISATGGSPEVEISGDGHVGPTEVSPGTYELGEVAFPSVTWGTDPDPWGPETWGGNYSQGQWDCGGAFMPTPTSVVVAPGSGGSPYLAATQVPSDPTYRALLSGGKYEFKIGANLYQVLFNSAGKLGIFKRTASVAGSAWTLMDAVHAPGNLSGNGEVTQSGTTIAIAYLESGNVNMRIVEFSTVTDTWGTPTVAKAMLSSLATFAFVRQSSGTYVIIAGRPNAIYAVTNSGGLWGGTTILASLASGATVLSGAVDSSDRIWTLINTASTTVGVYAISPSLALGAVITTVSLLFPGGPYFYLYYPQIALWGTDGVAVAWNTALTIGGAGTISVKTITPLAAPVVTTSVAYTFGAGTERAYLFQPVDDGSGNLNLFFVDTDTGVNQVLQTLFDGTSTWGATSQFYDAVADPPPSGTTPSVISALQALKLAAGWTTGLTMQTSGPVDTAEFVEIVSPTNTVACQIVNTFIPTPPPPPPPGGGGENAVGCFELLRIDVTLTPAKRLPVRGSTR